MKRSIAVASFALLAVAALFVPAANAQQCGSGNGYNSGSYNGFNNQFNTGHSGAYNHFNSGIGFGSNTANNMVSGFGSVFGNIDNTQLKLENRIQAGINSGRITPREANQLQTKFNQIASLEARLRTSGNRLSFGERQRLNLQLARLNADITRQMNDRNFGHFGRNVSWNRY